MQCEKRFAGIIGYEDDSETQIMDTFVAGGHNPCCIGDYARRQL
jgi:hypothetical protein